MICGYCGCPEVIWVGPYSQLTHTECQNCGAVDAQVAEDEAPERDDQTMDMFGGDDGDL